MEKLQYTFDTQMIVEGDGVRMEQIKQHLSQAPAGDCLLVVGDDGFCRIHFHTNEPWEVLKYLCGIGTVSDIVIENMEKQQEEFQG